MKARMSSVPNKKIKNEVDFTLEELDRYLDDPTSNIKYCDRREYTEIKNYDEIVQHIVKDGLPLILTNTTKEWDRQKFSPDYLKQCMGETQLESSPRDNDKLIDLSGWTVNNYVDYFMKNPEDRKPPRLYGKDMPCPPEWVDYLAKKLPSYLVYRGECDLLADLREELIPLNLMIYVGFGGTYTPGHRDICGSLGHNVMTYAEADATAIWFCIAKKDVDQAIQFWQKHGGQLAHDNFFMPLQLLATAPFEVYVVKQKEGDLVLVPPECAHQVVNKGGRNIKIAWNTVTSRTIEISFREVLPRLKSIGKPEIYRIKAVAYFSLMKRIKLVNKKAFDKIDVEDFPYLLRVFRDALHNENLQSNVTPTIECPLPKLLCDEIPHARTCNFCHCDIFNRAFQCVRCTSKKKKSEGNKEIEIDYCLDCISVGRGCSKHILDLELVEHIPLDKLTKVYDSAVKAYATVLTHKGIKGEEKQNLLEEVKKDGLNTVPTCAIAAKRVVLYRKNEWVHCHQCKLNKPEYETISCRKYKKGCKRVTYPNLPKVLPLKKGQMTHEIILPKDPNGDKGKTVERVGLRLLFCERCLWNRYAMKIIDCLRDPEWECPSCEQKCNCAACLRNRGQVPEEYNVPTVVDSSTTMYSTHGIDAVPDGCCTVQDFLPRPRKRSVIGKGVLDSPKKVKLEPISSAYSDIVWAMINKETEFPWPVARILDEKHATDMVVPHDSTLVITMDSYERIVVKKEEIIEWEAESASQFIERGTESTDFSERFIIAFKEASNHLQAMKLKMDETPPSPPPPSLLSLPPTPTSTPTKQLLTLPPLPSTPTTLSTLLSPPALISPATISTPLLSPPPSLSATLPTTSKKRGRKPSRKFDEPTTQLEGEKKEIEKVEEKDTKKARKGKGKEKRAPKNTKSKSKSKNTNITPGTLQNTTTIQQELQALSTELLPPHLSFLSLPLSQSPSLSSSTLTSSTLTDIENIGAAIDQVIIETGAETVISREILATSVILPPDLLSPDVLSPQITSPQIPSPQIPSSQIPSSEIPSSQISSSQVPSFEITSETTPALPSNLSSSLPHDRPSQLPSEQPTIPPSAPPTDLPSSLPTSLSSTPQPNIPSSEAPSKLPSVLPPVLPPVLPSVLPSVLPPVLPSVLPSVLPPVFPSLLPSESATLSSVLADLPSAPPSPEPIELSLPPPPPPPGPGPTSESLAEPPKSQVAKISKISQISEIAEIDLKARDKNSKTPAQAEIRAEIQSENPSSKSQSEKSEISKKSENGENLTELQSKVLEQFQKYNSTENITPEMAEENILSAITSETNNNELANEKSENEKLENEKLQNEKLENEELENEELESGARALSNFQASPPKQSNSENTKVLQIDKNLRIKMSPIIGQRKPEQTRRTIKIKGKVGK